MSPIDGGPGSGSGSLGGIPAPIPLSPVRLLFHPRQEYFPKEEPVTKEGSYGLLRRVEEGRDRRSGERCRGRLVGSSLRVGSQPTGYLVVPSSLR